MSNPSVTLEDEFLEAARELRDVAKAKKLLDDRETRAKEILAKVLAEGEVGVDPESGLSLVAVRPGARVWSEDKARENLPTEILAQLEVTETVVKIDKQRARETLAPALYDLCTKQNRPSVVAL